MSKAHRHPRRDGHHQHQQQLVAPSYSSMLAAQLGAAAASSSEVRRSRTGVTERIDTEHHHVFAVRARVVYAEKKEV